MNKNIIETLKILNSEYIQVLKTVLAKTKWDWMLEEEDGKVYHREKGFHSDFRFYFIRVRN